MKTFKSILSENEVIDEPRKIKVGDFVNLVTWYPDIYSQVLFVFDSDDSKAYIGFIKYSKYGKKRWTDSVLGLDKIRKVKTLEEIGNDFQVMYTDTKYVSMGSGTVDWKVPFDKNSRHNSNDPEIYSNIVKNNS